MLGEENRGRLRLLTDDSSYFRLDGLPDRDPFRDNAVVLQLGSFSLKFRRFGEPNWTEVPPVFIKGSRTKFGYSAIESSKVRGTLVNVFNGNGIYDINSLVKVLGLIFGTSLDGAAILICEQVPEMKDLETSRQLRRELARCLIREFQAQAYFAAPEPTLAIASFPRANLGCETGVVIDVGHAHTTISCVLDGKLLPRCTSRTLIAGNFFDEILFKQLCDQIGGGRLDNRWSISKLKHQVCFVSADATMDLSKCQDEDSEFFKNLRIKSLCENGCSVSIDKDRFMVPEVLFDPECIPTGYDSSYSFKSTLRRTRKLYMQLVHNMILANNANFDTAAARTLFDRFFIVGGSTEMQGMMERIIKEIRIEAAEFDLGIENCNPNYLQEEIERQTLAFFRKTDPSERSFSAALGGERFVEEAENELWVYDFQVEDQNKDMISMKCPQ